MSRGGWITFLTLTTGCLAHLAQAADSTQQPLWSSAAQSFPGAGPELLVDGRMDQPGSAWAAPGSPNWVEIDFGQQRLITEISVAPFIGSPGESYFYNEAWKVQYLDDQGQIHDFSNVQKIMGAGTLIGPGIAVANGDPGSTASLDSHKYYGFIFEPVTTQYVRFTVTSGDRDGDSNGAELEVRQAFQTGTPVTLGGKAGDAEDGDISSMIDWSSNLAGFLGSGASLTLSDLMVGTHTITALVQDSQGAQATSTTSVTILDVPATSYSLTTSILGNGAGTVTSSPAGIDCGADCKEFYTQDSLITLSATPDPGSIFIGWGGHTDCGDGQLTMSADRACSAQFDRQVHPLSVTMNGAGQGLVTSSPSGIDCGSDCSQDFDHGTVVILSATADTGSSFAGWSGDGDCADSSIAMTTARACTANFDVIAAPKHTLTAGKEGTGSGKITSSPSGIDCGSDCSQAFEEGTAVGLQATPASGSTFDGWSGDNDCGDGQVMMTGQRNCRAVFNAQVSTRLPLSVARSGGGSGHVISFPAGIDCGADCDEAFDKGASVRLQATADEGSFFIGWSGTSDCRDGEVKMRSARNCIATFEGQPSDVNLLSVAKSGSGSGTVTSAPSGIDCGNDCTQPFDKRISVSLTALADPGSVFVGWSGAKDCRDGRVRMRSAQECVATFDNGQ